MKKIVSDKILREKMLEAIDVLCNTVKTTLGPKGCNVIIDHSSFSPFITNDGVTIASNIESDDEVINTILEIAKESSIKTNETVGDGTTTTLVLLQAIFKLGIKYIEEGINPIILKKYLNESLEKIILKVNQKSHKPTEEELFNIASISANSKNIGKIVSDAFLKVKNKSAVKIKESDDEKTKVNFKKGYTIETILGSTYFFKDTKEINLQNTYILLINKYLTDIENISKVINFIIENNKSLVIIAEDYSDDFVNEIVSIYLQENINIILLKTPEYGTNKLDVLNDIALISKAKIFNDFDFITINDLGRISSVTINKEETTFDFSINEQIKKKINELQKNREKDIEEFNLKRISMFASGIVEIQVGAKTETERREKKMRYDDCLCAVSSAMNGVIPGSGVILYEISDNLKIQNIGDKIMKEALKKPFEQIMYNAGVDDKEILSLIKKKDYQIIYNIKTEQFENFDKTEVLDPKDVIVNSLTNAISIASMLLSTTSLIINEHQNNLNKLNDYNEL